MTKATGKGAAEGNGAKQPPEPPPAFHELMDRLGGQATYVRLYRMVAGRRSYLQKYGTEFEEADVQEKYGGGEYTAQVCDVRGAIVGSMLFAIEGPPRQPPPDPVAAGRLVGYSAPQGEPARDLVDGFRRMEDLLRDLRNPPAVAQQANPIEMAAALMDAVSKAAAPFIEVWKVTREAGRERDDDKPGAVELMQAYQSGLKTGVHLGTRTGGGGSGGGSSSILDRLLDTVGPAIRGEVGRPELGRGAPPEDLPASSPVPADAPTWATALAPHVKRLNTMAAGGHDPELYADLAFDLAPPAALEAIAAELGKGEEFYVMFFRAFPSCEPHKRWWVQFLGRLWLTFSQPPEEESGVVHNGDNATAG